MRRYRSYPKGDLEYLQRVNDVTGPGTDPKNCGAATAGPERPRLLAFTMGDSYSPIWSPHWQQTMQRSGHRLFPPCRPSKGCRLTGSSSAVWRHLSDHRRSHPAHRGWYGHRCAGERRIRMAQYVLSMAGAGGTLPARHPRLACRLPLTERMIWPRILDVWSTHSSSLLARLL